MDLAPQNLSLIITVLVIIGALGLALIVDLLQGNVQQLREVAIDLQAQKEAAERQVQNLERHTAALQQQQLPGPVAAGPEPPKQTPQPIAEASNQQPQQQQQEEAKRIDRTETAAVRRAMSPAVAAVAESVAVRMAANGFKPAATAPAVPAAPVSLPPLRAGSSAETRKNWSEILNAHKHGRTYAEESGVNNLIPFDKIRNQEGLPAGYHDYSVLQRIAGCGQMFTGLAISIGTNPLDRQQVGLVGGFLRSLLGASDFGCLSGNHEFVMVCPGIEGEAAQRRLAGVAEKLWDFQLRSMGSIHVQFSWGGKEGRNASLNEAVAAAVDQMQETRRSRPVLPTVPAVEFQRAV